METENSTPDLLPSSVEEEAVTDTSLVTPSLPAVTEQDRTGAGEKEKEREEELLLGRRSERNINFSSLNQTLKCPTIWTQGGVGCFNISR